MGLVELLGNIKRRLEDEFRWEQTLRLESQPFSPPWLKIEEIYPKLHHDCLELVKRHGIQAKLYDRNYLLATEIPRRSKNPLEVEIAFGDPDRENPHLWISIREKGSGDGYEFYFSTPRGFPDPYGCLHRSKYDGKRLMSSSLWRSTGLQDLKRIGLLVELIKKQFPIT